VGKLVLDIPGPIARNATVLITGGTGGLGGLVARHLARRHGVRHLLLASRRGPEAEGAAELRADLERTGAEVAVVACDVGDRDRVAELLDAIPARRPLDTVVHAAGVLDDDLLGSLTPGQVDRVFAPKVDGAWHLHDLTQDLDLSRFVMFSSVAGVLGSPGQANYAAANAFLDALAQRRHAMGLPATSLAWGLWERRTGMTSHVGGADTARLARGGVAPLSDEDGLALRDAALGVDRPVVLAASLARRRAGALGLSAGEPTRDGRAAPADASLRRRIAALPGAEERRSLVLEAVRAEAAAVLGDASAAAAPSERTFKELGLESLGAVELRNRLETATGLALEATVAFDHPSPGELADHLLAELTVAFDSASSG
jgi:NAD(P)-dependent dehydrogenase (short-subunit alcohol dehydrogenase family)/acyl carrier protein